MASLLHALQTFNLVADLADQCIAEGQREEEEFGDVPDEFLGMVLTETMTYTSKTLYCGYCGGC
jgi:hypothetical protein